MKYLSSPKKIAAEMRTLKLKEKNSLISLLLYIATLITLIYPIFQPRKAQAAVTQAFVRFDRLSAGEDVAGWACLETTTVGTESNVVIVFPLAWTLPAGGSWTISVASLPQDPTSPSTTATAWPNMSGGSVSVSGANVTFTPSGSGDIPNDGNLYCFHFTGGASSNMTAGNDLTGQLKTQGGSPYVDSVDWATSIVSAGNDQITVTASVSAQMTFSLDSNSVTLGTLSSSSVTSHAGITQSVATNARNGWVSWVKSANGSLNSASASDTIASPGTSNATPDSLAAQAGYVLDVNSGTGTPTITAEFDGADTNSGGHLDTVFQQTARNTIPTAGDTAVLIVRAKSGAINAAATDYTDTLTVVAAGSF